MENINNHKPAKKSPATKVLKIVGGILIFLFAVNIRDRRI